MNIDLFFTLQTTQGGAPVLPGQPGGKPGATPAQGMSFIDLILAQLTQVTETKNQQEQTPPQDSQLLQSDNPALSKNPSLDLAKILAVNEDIEDQLVQDTKTFNLDPQAQITQTLALNQQAMDSELKPVTALKNVIESLLLKAQNDNKGGNGHETAIGKLELILGRLQELEQEQGPAFIATNLTPEQITQLQQQLQTPQNSDDQQKFAGIFVGLINIVAPQERTASSPTLPGANANNNKAAALTPTTAAPQPTDNSGGGSTSNAPQDLAAKLNALMPGREGEVTTIGDELDAMSLEDKLKFRDILRQVGSDIPAAARIIPVRGGEAPAPAATPPGLSTLQGWPFTLEGSLFSSTHWSDPAMEKLGLQGYGPTASSPANLASLVTGAPSAAQAHSTSQIIAATIQKNAAGGENRDITLQLDPPELGRMKIKLEFGSDKTLKTVMVIEKPETFAMLQRDAHVLERAIQDIGLDSGGMEFELAQHEGDFSHDGGHDGNGGYAGNDAGQNNENEIIETRMDWYVDPHTGLTRYDVLV